MAQEASIRPFFLLSLLVLAALGPLEARAVAPQDPATQAAVGAGGTSRATVDDLGSILTAPGLLPLSARYEIAGGAAIGPDGELGYQVAAMDSRTGPVTLGLSWMRRTGTLADDPSELPGWVGAGDDLDNPEMTQTFGGALAGSWLDRQLGVAVGATWNQRSSRYGDDQGALDGIVSVAGTVGGIGRLSLTGSNFVLHRLDSAPFTVAAGGGIEDLDVGRVEADILLDMGTELTDVAVGWRAGGAVEIAGLVPLRAGVQRDGRADTWLVTGGLGIGNEQASLDYGMRYRLGDGSGGEDGTWAAFTSRTWHGLSLLLRL